MIELSLRWKPRSIDRYSDKFRPFADYTDEFCPFARQTLLGGWPLPHVISKPYPRNQGLPYQSPTVSSLGHTSRLTAVKRTLVRG